MRKEKTILFGLIFLILSVIGGCKGPGQEQAGSPGFPPPAVDIEIVKSRPYTPVRTLPGRVAPVREAQIRARVAGIILSRHFEEGRDVKKGELLFKIDPAPFEADLAKARAGLAAAEAGLFDARTVADRYKVLVKTGAVSSQQWDSAQAKLKEALANKSLSRAEVRTAELNLGYATVTAPISGRIGRAMVTEGALVGQGEATLLATIHQVDTIYVDFTQPVPQYLRIRAAFERDANGTVSGENQAVGNDRVGEPSRVELILEDIDLTLEGKFLFSDVLVDSQTGQVSLRAQFSNKKGWLLPGMFVRVKTTLATDQAAVFVPQRAVLRDFDGSATVMVLDDKSKVAPRPVQLGVMEKGNWLVLQGLNPGEKIVTTGADKVRPGMTLGTPKEGAETEKG